MHLFPCVPPGATIAFDGFHARGGFVVSAEMVGGEVAWVEILSRRDLVCRLRNPWPGRSVQVTDTAGRAVRARCEQGRHEYIRFDAVKGGRYRLWVK